MKNANKYELKAVANTNYKFDSMQIKSAADAEKYARQFYADDIVIYESVFIMLLNRSNKVTGWAKISQGGTASSVCDIKMICKYAIDTLSEGVILCHNHPSGNPSPGTADINTTERLKKALDLLDIHLLDHIILTEDNCYSFSEGRKL